MSGKCCGYCGKFHGRQADDCGKQIVEESEAKLGSWASGHQDLGLNIEDTAGSTRGSLARNHISPAGEEMNTKLLRKVQKHILEEPKRLFMGDWIRRVDPQGKGNPECGIVGCIAGWSVALSLKRPFVNSTYVASKAQALLGLSDEEGDRLFLMTGQRNATHAYTAECWPEKFSEAHGNAVTAKGRARVVAKRIDHFIKTKGKE